MPAKGLLDVIPCVCKPTQRKSSLVCESNPACIFYKKVEGTRSGSRQTGTDRGKGGKSPKKVKGGKKEVGATKGETGTGKGTARTRGRTKIRK